MIAGTDQRAGGGKLGMGEPPLGAHSIRHLAIVDQMATLADSISFF